MTSSKKTRPRTPRIRNFTPKSKFPLQVPAAKGSSQVTISQSSQNEQLKIAYLDEKYLPSLTNPQRRLIVFGDVHGMPDAVKCLLDGIQYNSVHDHQVFVGDMITKGRMEKTSGRTMSDEEMTIEASRAVLKRAMKARASAVLGNHEDILLNVGKKGYQENLDRTLDRVFSAKKNLRTPTESDKALYDALSSEEKSWLKELPHILVLGKVGGRENMVVVHAGLNPTLELKEQIVLETMNLKSIDPSSGNTSSMCVGDKEVEIYVKSVEEEKRFKEMKPWHEPWDDKQQQLLNDEQQQLLNDRQKLLDDRQKLWDDKQQQLLNDRQKLLNDKQQQLLNDRQKLLDDEQQQLLDDKQQELLKKPTTVIYGHDSKRGLVEKFFSIGLDTGVQREDDDSKYRTLTVLVIKHNECRIFQVKQVVVKKGKKYKWEWKLWNVKGNKPCNYKDYRGELY